MRGYAICTAPRSGSNFLSLVLASTGVLGNPLEYFNGPGRRHFDDPAYPDDPHEQLGRILTMGATSNGVYAVKIFAHQHDLISPKVRWTEHLPELKFVLLTRRDMLGQAISWTRASQTGQYRQTQQAISLPKYDADAISAFLTRIVSEQARWEIYFARNGVAPLRLIYEDVIASPHVAVDCVARLIALQERATIAPHHVGVRVQRDQINEDWRSRFLAERSDLDFVDGLSGCTGRRPWFRRQLSRLRRWWPRARRSR